MPTSNRNRKLLDLKRWEMVSPPPNATAAGTCVISSSGPRQQQLFLINATAAALYNPFEDGWCYLPSPALAGTFGAGTCGVSTEVGPSGTATGGTATTINTTLNLQRGLVGYSVHVTAGPGAGETRAIVSNTTGANSIVTTAAFSTPITAASVFRLLTPRWFVLNAGTLAAGSFRVYDFALNTWTSLAITGLPATLGTDAKLVNTPSWDGNDYQIFATGAATSATATTLVNSAKTWTVNQWSNAYQVRIVSGLGAGQIRAIVSNTATALTVAAWTTTPDVTSVYAIEGNDDSVYLLGNNAVTLYRYSVVGNTAVTVTPGAARAGAFATGGSAHLVRNAEESDWTNESAIINGRRIYSFRGGATGVLDYYDIALNTWVSGVPYSPLTETFTTGTKYIYADSYLYIQKDATGRWFRYSFARSAMDGVNTCLYPQGAAVVGDTAFDVEYIDGTTEIRYLYMILNTSQIMLRMMVI